MADSKDPKDLVTTIMQDTDIAILTHVDAAGRLVSMPMGTQDFVDPVMVHFLTEADSEKMAAITENPQVNVAYASDAGWVSLSGIARHNEDRSLLKDLWDAKASTFVPGGPDDPNSTVLTVVADTARYWGSPGTVATVVEMAKGAASGQGADPGVSGIVAL